MRADIPELFTRAVSYGEDAPAPRALFVFAHPDDETLALGSRLQRFTDGLLIHVTDGAPRNGYDSTAHGFKNLDEYRAARFTELDRALTVGGAEGLPRRCLGIADQEASMQLLRMTQALAEIVREYRPDVIFTHAYEGGHPDHDACAFAVHHAVQESAGKRPLVIECSLYHTGPHGMETFTFLSHPDALQEHATFLTPGEQNRKQAMLACFTSQRETLSQFGTVVEMFRVAPRYDFTQPPHTRPLFYDQFAWGMTSQRFCKLAREAEHSLRAHEVSA